MKKFYICKHCGNIVELVQDKGVPVVCCGEPMVELVANTTDAATEKHVPVVNVDGNTVTVAIGEVEHPMVEEHFIQWVEIETTHGSQRKVLKAGQEPKATFVLAEGEKLMAAYEYCNLHGLWKKEM